MITKPKFLYRFLKALVNFLLVVLFSLFLDGVILTKIAWSIPKYAAVQQDYIALKQEYEDLEDVYGLYTYDEDGKRVKVPDADDTAFKNDPRVKEIIVLGRNDQRIMNNVNLVSIVISYVFSFLIVFLIPPIFSKKNYDLGSRAFSIVLSQNGELVSKKRYYGYTFLYLLMHYILGLGTLFIFNLVDYLVAVFSKEKQMSLMERWFKYEYAIDFDKVEGDLITEEKAFENEHSYSDQTPRDIFKLK